MIDDATDGQVTEDLKLGLLGESVGPGVRQLRNLLTSRIIAAYEPFGLRSGSHSTMALIAANPGCSQSEIARNIGMDKSIVVAIVDDLERNSLAERRRSIEDRRRNVLNLTEKGRALMMELDRLARSVEQPIRNALSPDEMETLILLTRRAVDALAATEPG